MILLGQIDQQIQLMEQLRQTMLSEAEMMSSKKRFGLFSQPPPLALGDNGGYNSKTARKGEDGKPITLPRNMLAGPNKSGITRKDFITPPSSIHVGDKYLDPQKVDLLYNKKFHTKASFHQLEFKPSSGTKTSFGSSYKHIDENPTEKKKPPRDETGRVITKQRNITTNPMGKVHKDLFKHPKYIIDPYERKEQLEQQHRRIQKEKQGEEMIRSMSHGDILFSSHRMTYGIDPEGEELLKKKKIFVNSPPRAVHHETQFKLSRRGHGDPIGRYPEFIPPSEVQSEVPRIKKQKSEKEEWKHVGNRSLSRPTPSISYSAFSLRKYK